MANTATQTFTIGPEDIPTAATLAHIGVDMAAPATFLQGATARGGGLLALDLKLARSIIVRYKATFAYTGGTTNPTIWVGLQRKIDYSLEDTDDNAWDDVGSFDGAVTVEKVAEYGERVVFSYAASTEVDQQRAVQRDNTGLQNYGVHGWLGDKLRVRIVFRAAGDRTGGTATIILAVTMGGQ